MTPDEFRAARKLLGLTQAGLAAVLGRSKSAVEKWERGEVDMLVARYMTALLVTGWRPDDWPMQKPAAA